MTRFARPHSRMASLGAFGARSHHGCSAAVDFRIPAEIRKAGRGDRYSVRHFDSILVDFDFRKRNGSGGRNRGFVGPSWGLELGWRGAPERPSPPCNSFFVLVEKCDFRFSLIEECGYRTFPPKEETALNAKRKGRDPPQPPRI